jgi:hypothetical protein
MKTLSLSVYGSTAIFWTLVAFQIPASNNSYIVASRSCRTDRVENTASQLVDWYMLPNNRCCLQSH